MMELSKIDQLNNLKTRSIPYKKYFGEMELDEEEKEKRIALANKLESIFFSLLVFCLDEEQIEFDKDRVKGELTDTITEYLKIKVVTSFVEQYVDGIVDDIVRVTTENIKDKYYTSNDRAKFIAENEANVIGNYDLQNKAIKNGFTKKEWLTKEDNIVRHTHRKVNHSVIGIFEPFEVGDSLLMYPKDNSYGASADEIVNCRCVCIYHR